MRSIAQVILGALPAPLVSLAARAKRRFPVLGGISRRLTAGFKNRESIIRGGAGQGLRFNPGPGNFTMLLGTYEGELQQELARIIESGMTCYDVGANAGFFSLIMARLTGPEGLVYAFEPHPQLAELVRKNAEANGMTQIRVIEYAVADRVSRESLMVDEDLSCSRLAEGHSDTRLAIPIEGITLDHFLGIDGNAPPSLVKIDVEGAEVRVLNGMKQILETVRPIIICEAHRTSDELVRVFERNGYTCVWQGDPATRNPPYPQVVATPRSRGGDDA